MSNVETLITQSSLLQHDIDRQVEALATVEPLQLPGKDSALVGHFVTKIENNYDTRRAKTDTDHAIDLLYIAYNTTPQEQGRIRLQISNIMNKLVTAQKESEAKIRNAVQVSNNIHNLLKRALPDWLDVKAGNDPDEIKAFVVSDLIVLARDITTFALRVKQNLDSIVTTYDQILVEIKSATDNSELALSDKLEASSKIRNEILVANARRDQLDSLVRDLQEQICKYEAMARQYGAQADTAEKRSFWASIVQTATQMVSSMMPMVAMAMTGGSASLLGAASIGTAVRQKLDNNDPGKDVKRSELSAQRESQNAVVKDHQKRVDDLQAQLQSETNETRVAALKSSIEAAESNRQQEQAKLEGINQQLESLLKELSAAAAGISNEQKVQATNLRALEAQMMDNVEEYEAVRREQAAELVKITVLLEGQRTEQDTIELAVRSLNVSVTALKRNKEIVQEMAFFFKSFSDFMQVIIDEATLQLDDYEKAGNSAVLRENRLKNLRTTTDEFFVTQTAEWLAVGVVSDRFVDLFQNGWSKLNTLSGTYITGDRLKAYLDRASVQLKQIASDREAASRHRVESLHAYRDELMAQAAMK